MNDEDRLKEYLDDGSTREQLKDAFTGWLQESCTHMACSAWGGRVSAERSGDSITFTLLDEEGIVRTTAVATRLPSYTELLWDLRKDGHPGVVCTLDAALVTGFLGFSTYS
jgi:hypothetical protein